MSTHQLTEQRQDPHLEYTKEQLVKHIFLLEEHFKNYQCPVCIKKHLLGIEGYAEEGIPMSQHDAPLFIEIAGYCRDTRMSRQVNALEVIRKLRAYRERLEGEGHSHGAAETVQNPHCVGGKCG